MKHITSNTLKTISTLVILFIMIISSGVTSAGAADAQAIFTVQWYDVGQDALEGLKGIEKVEKGWRGSSEINTVYYDSDLITIEEMEAALKAAGTYVGTVEE